MRSKTKERWGGRLAEAQRSWRRRQARRDARQATGCAAEPATLTAAAEAVAIAKRLLGNVPLFVTIGREARANTWMRCVRQRGGEFLLALVTAAGVGRFIGVATVSTCDLPACRRNHEADENHVSLIASVLRLCGPSRIRVSAGWLGLRSQGV